MNKNNGNMLEKQMSFLIEADKLKNIFRQSLITDKSRYENDAEHSWHCALMALVLAEYAEPGVDLLRVLKMAVIHDLVEIYAGDTFAYDAAGNAGKPEREAESAERLFSILPEEQGCEIKALWLEFDLAQTPDARYASAMDRLSPLVLNYMTEGYAWKKHGVTKEMVLKRMAVIKDGAPGLWDYVEGLVNDSVSKGYLK